MAQVIDSDVVFDGKVGHNTYHTNIADMEHLLTQALAQVTGTISASDGVNIAALQAFITTGASVGTITTVAASGDTSGATDHTNIAAALAGGGSVQLKAGTYYVNSALTVSTQGQAIFGQYSSVPKPAQKNMPTIIKLANAANSSIFSVTVGGCYIGYLQLDGNNTNQSSGSNAVISLSGSNGACTVERCQVLNGFADGIQMTNAGAHKVVNSWVGLCSGHGINVGTTSDNTIIGTLVGSCTLDNVYTAGFVTHIIDCDIFSSSAAGIHCDASGSAFIITNCGVDRNNHEGILVSAGGAQISNCTIHSNSQAGSGSYNSINFTSGTTQSVTGCHFWLDGGITNLPAYHIGFSGGGAAKTYNNQFASGSYLTGTISAPSSQPDTFETGAAIRPSGDTTGAIDTAILQLAAGNAGIDQLGAGTFYVNAPIPMATGAGFNGAGKRGTIINLASGFSGAAAFTITGSSAVTISNLQIAGQNSTYSMNPAADGIHVAHASGPNFQNLLMQFLNGWGVSIVNDVTGSTSYPVLENVHPSHCANGILLQGDVADNNVNSGAFITDCNVEACQAGDGLLIQDVHDVTVRNFEGFCVSGAGNTIHIKGAATTTYLSGMVIGALTSGSPTSQATVLIESSGGNTPQGVSFENCIVEYGSPSVSITGGQQVNFTGCTLSNAGTASVATSGASTTNILIAGNTFHNNGLTAGTNYELSLGASGNQQASNNIFTTPQGSSSGQVTAAINPTAGTTVITSNFFAGAPGFSTNLPTVARSNQGYNPVGSLTVAVPASAAAVAAYSADRIFYVNGDSVDTVSLVISGVAANTTLTIAAGALNVAVTVPAGQTLTPTYTAAHPPTWTVYGL